MSIVAIGETVLDIIIKNGKPLATNPGGSSLNAIVSLGRLGLEVKFISELGNDPSGRQILQFLEENNVITEYVTVYPHNQTAIALAHLDAQNNATYTFYKDYPHDRLTQSFPDFTSSDFLLFGSSFALNPLVRVPLLKLLGLAHTAGSIIYYDPNYRPKAGISIDTQKDLILENIRLCNILRGSDEDFESIFGHTDLQSIKSEINSPQLKIIICTQSDQCVSILYEDTIHTFLVPNIKVKSTIGAGDNFNAGFLFGLAKYGLSLENLSSISPQCIEDICLIAIGCAGNVCCSLDNYISTDYAKQIGV